jgi:hypothetical protein
MFYIIGVSMRKSTKGRKPLPKGVARSKNINIRVTATEHKEIDRAAKSEGDSITDWCRCQIFKGMK